MALSLEAAGLVKQKTRHRTRDPLVNHALQAFFARHAQKGNADLQLVEIDDTDLTGTNGVIVATPAAVVYVAFIRKRATATDSYFKIYDDATVDTTATDARVVLPLLEASEDNIVIFPDGLDMADGIVATSHTTPLATVDSTAGDSGDGFIILGASGAD